MKLGRKGAKNNNNQGQTNLLKREYISSTPKYIMIACQYSEYEKNIYSQTLSKSEYYLITFCNFEIEVVLSFIKSFKFFVEKTIIFFPS